MMELPRSDPAATERVDAIIRAGQRRSTPVEAGNRKARRAKKAEQRALNKLCRKAKAKFAKVK